MLEQDIFIQDGLQAELILQYRLKTLRNSLHQRLEEMKMRQTEELEKRFHQNALLSAEIKKKPLEKEDKNTYMEFVNVKRSTSAGSPRKGASHTKIKQRSDTSFQDCGDFSVKTKECVRILASKPSQLKKEQEDETECQKKFCAVAAPKHIIKPIYQEMIENRDRERKRNLEQRKQFLLSLQKPFTFQERLLRKSEKLETLINQVSLDPDTVRDQTNIEKKKPLILQASQQEKTHRNGSPKLHTAERSRVKPIRFLDTEPSFKPKIIHQVPDFRKLHKALQTEGMRKVKTKDATRCQPFVLRTSLLLKRRRRKSLETSDIKHQIPAMNHLSRSKSLGTLMLVSADTLPTYITDAVRKRREAIKMSMELRESKNQESLSWFKNYQMGSKALRKSVSLHAKLLDPHSTLKETNDVNLQNHRKANQQRMKDYARELQEMKTRVRERPYLFEQLNRRNAKARAEQKYTSKLEEVGLKVEFVEEEGETARNDDNGTETNILSAESSIHSREKNVDDWKKIEDVNEESMKSKGEETP